MVACIIPHFNYGRYLEDAVRSICEQVDIVIIVDDHSDCENRNLARAVWKKYQKKVTFEYNIGKRGMACARNHGLYVAKLHKADFVLFLDADDMCIAGSVKKQMDYFESHPDTMVVWGWALEIRGNIGLEEAEKLKDSLRWHPSEVNPQTVMYRMEVFEKYGCWYEQLLSGTDKEMCMRLGLHPDSPFKGLVKCKKLKEPLAFYRKHPEQIHKRRKADHKWAKKTKRIQKKRIKQLKREGITKDNTRFL